MCTEQKRRRRRKRSLLLPADRQVQRIKNVPAHAREKRERKKGIRVRKKKRATKKKRERKSEKEKRASIITLGCLRDPRTIKNSASR